MKPNKIHNRIHNWRDYCQYLQRLEENRKWANEKLREIQAKCPHEKTEFVPDASGNNDSYYECVVCRAPL